MCVCFFERATARGRVAGRAVYSRVQCCFAHAAGSVRGLWGCVWGAGAAHWQVTGLYRGLPAQLSCYVTANFIYFYAYNGVKVSSSLR